MVQCSLRTLTGTTRRSLGVLLVALVLLPSLASCTKGKRADVDPRSAAAGVAEGEERIIGVTTKDGRAIEFDDPGAHLRNDTLYARVDGAYVTVALADADHVVVERRVADTLATVALVAGVGIGILFLIAAATQPTFGSLGEGDVQSCPTVYSWNGATYVLDAEPYGGAIARGLERSDYSPLEHLVATEGHYRVRVANEMDETQRTDFLELLAVKHRPDARIAADADGNIYDVRGRRPPVAARDASGRDLLPWLVESDRLVWEPLPVADEEGRLHQEIILTFPRDPDASDARLVVKAATAAWGSHMIRKLLELRGADGAESWLAELDADQPERTRLDDWLLREQLYYLRVFVEEATGWEERGVLRGEGPIVSHDRVLPLDVSRAVGESLRIRIQPPRGFWALNSFAIDYGTEPRLSTERIALREARAADATDVTSPLARIDGRYHEMPAVGDYVTVMFPAPDTPPGYETTVILHSRGYYDLHLDPAGQGDDERLARILEEPGAAARYSAELYGSWDAGALMRRLGEEVAASR